jgi:hypothetical protein
MIQLKGNRSSQFGDDRVTEVGGYLDATLEAILRNAAD